MVLKVVYEIFDSFQLLSLISFSWTPWSRISHVVALPLAGRSIPYTLYGRGHRPSHAAYIGRLVSMPPLTDQSGPCMT